MPRTTAEALRKLFPHDKVQRDVDHYIADANVMVTELLGTSGLSAERLEMIERYYAAHLYVLGEQEGGIFEDEIGGSSTKMGSTFTLGQGLRLTRFGQQVLGLDTTGAFEAISSQASGKKKAEFRLA